LEGAAVMNNTFTTGVFFALVYLRGIAWEFQAEIIVIVFVQVCMGLMMLNTKMQLLYHACLVFSFFPLFGNYMGIGKQAEHGLSHKFIDVANEWQPKSLSTHSLWHLDGYWKTSCTWTEPWIVAIGL